MRPIVLISDRIQRTILVALQAVALLLIVVVTLPHVYQWHTLDVGIYYRASLNLMQGALPYRDFVFEYPPLALLPFSLPLVIAPDQSFNFSSYVWRFLIQNALFSTLIALTVVKVLMFWLPSRKTTAPLVFFALLVAVSAPLLPWRYDLFPALLTVLALLCVLSGLPLLAGIWLGLGVAAKLYPIVLMPIFAAYYLASGNRPAMLRLTLGSIDATALPLVPFVLTDPASMFAFLRYHEMRGLQIESLPAGAILLAQLLGIAEARLAFNYGALHLASPLADAALKWLPLAFVGLFGLVLASALARFREERLVHGTISHASMVAYVVAGLLAFMVTNKVFSPQYIVWLLPFAPLLPWRQAGLLVAIYAITIAIFPFDYADLLALHTFPVLLLNLRNLLVIGLLIWLVAERLPVLARTAPNQLYQALRRFAHQSLS
jgi:uncharacterized membrane protein